MTYERNIVDAQVRKVLLKEHIAQEAQRAGLGGIDIQRTPVGTKILLKIERPGMVIGRQGAIIKKLTNMVEKDFGFRAPHIEVEEVRDNKADLNPNIMAQRLVSALERGWHYRRAGHQTVARIMRAGAKGCQVILSGKLTGARHRTAKFLQGHVKFCGETKLQWMDEGYALAKKKLGTIGVTVQIMDANAKLPDEVEIKPRTTPLAETRIAYKERADDEGVEAPTDEQPSEEEVTPTEGDVTEDAAAEEPIPEGPADEDASVDDEAVPEVADEPGDEPADTREE